MAATIKQKKAFQEVVNGSTITAAMVKAGYSKTTAKRTNKVTRTKGWQELMQDYLPDELLGEKHRELLTVPIKVKTRKRGELIDSIEMVDSFAISKGLEMAYKLKGKYAPEKHSVVTMDLSPAMKEYADRLLDAQRNTDTRTED
jgi:hypothetical protein